MVKAEALLIPHGGQNDGAHVDFEENFPGDQDGLLLKTLSPRI